MINLAMLKWLQVQTFIVAFCILFSGMSSFAWESPPPEKEIAQLVINALKTEPSLDELAYNSKGIKSKDVVVKQIKIAKYPKYGRFPQSGSVMKYGSKMTYWPVTANIVTTYREDNLTYGLKTLQEGKEFTKERSYTCYLYKDSAWKITFATPEKIK